MNDSEGRRQVLALKLGEIVQQTRQEKRPGSYLFRKCPQTFEDEHGMEELKTFVEKLDEISDGLLGLIPKLGQ
jgi:hypothetical protein